MKLDRASLEKRLATADATLEPLLPICEKFERADRGGPRAQVAFAFRRLLPRRSRLRSRAATGAAMEGPLVAGDASVAVHVDGEFVVGMMPPWARRPLEFGGDSRGPWFEGGGVAVRN